LRNTWKEVGLGCLNLVLLVAMIILVQPWLRKHTAPLLGAAILTLLCFVAYVAASKWIERRSPTELAADRALPEGIAGIALGFVLFSAVMGILWATGVYHFEGKGTADQLAKGFVLAALAGVLEEILFRGLLFRLSAKIFGTWGALLLTAALFGAAHAANPVGSGHPAGCTLCCDDPAVAAYRCAHWLELHGRFAVWHVGLGRDGEQRNHSRDGARFTSSHRRAIWTGSLDCGGAGVPGGSSVFYSAYG
jgi:membrane protease YdiL (CAAX protease family)